MSYIESLPGTRNLSHLKHTPINHEEKEDDGKQDIVQKYKNSRTGGKVGARGQEADDWKDTYLQQ